ncbi:MAG: site-2 protease family protein [Pirellulales bacterium]
MDSSHRSADDETSDPGTSPDWVAPPNGPDVWQPSSAPKRRVALPLTLFALTCLSTFWTGSVRAEPFSDGERLAAFDPRAGVTYMLCVMSILLAHEMGHFLTALYHRVPASLPYFIPMPLLPLGTMGAVIGMQGSQADRKQLFDIGLAGPIAGLLLAVPISWYGIATAVPYEGVARPTLVLHDPYIFQWLAHKLHPDWSASQVCAANPYYLAGWLGMLITGLNMLPISQLDGGHTAYGLFGRNARVLGRGFFIYALWSVTLDGQSQWVVMLVILFLLGIDHPPTRNDSVRIGALRWIVGFLALLIPLGCLTPMPISVGLP